MSGTLHEYDLKNALLYGGIGGKKFQDGQGRVYLVCDISDDRGTPMMKVLYEDNVELTESGEPITERRDLISHLNNPQILTDDERIEIVTREEQGYSREQPAHAID